MRPTNTDTPYRGFVLAEAAALAVVVAAIIAVLLVASGESRRQGMLEASFSNLKQYAAAYATYAADNDNRVATFSWRAGPLPEGFGNANTDVEAAAAQAVDIIRRRSMLQDFSLMQNWVPHPLYNHLVLVDYVGESLPNPIAVSPADRNRIEWQRAFRQGPQTYLQLTNRPHGYTPHEAYRWVFSSSYEIGPAFWSRDGWVDDIWTVSQGTDHRRFNTGTNGALGRRRLDEVRFPSLKVMVYDSEQRHFGQRRLYFAHSWARLPMLHADGSATVRTTGDANRGFDPNYPVNSNPVRITYIPDNWEAPTASGHPSEIYFGYYRWTRSGLRGRDFGGPEVPWQP